MQDEHSLLQLEEAIEALDAALEFKNRSVQDKQKKLSITDSCSSRSQSTEPAQLCDVTGKLKELTVAEASELLVMYFNKVKPVPFTFTHNAHVLITLVFCTVFNLIFGVINLALLLFL